MHLLQLELGIAKLMSFQLDVPCMTNKSFIQNSNKIAEVINESAWEQMRLAGLEEKKLALERNDVDIDGIPMCPVVADGQWGKRSYKTKYDSLSGAVILIFFFLLFNVYQGRLLIFLYCCCQNVDRPF